MKRIVVASYKKSGATWFRFLVYGAEKGLPKSSSEIDQFYPHDDSKYVWPVNTKRSFLKTHCNYESNRLTLTDNEGSILIVRNPLDILFSWLSHKRINGCLIYKSHNVAGQFSMMNEELEKMYSHYNSWKDQASIIIKYEDMLKDIRGTLNNVNNKLFLDWSEKDIDNAIASGKKERMAQIEEYEIKNKITEGFFYELKKADPYINRGERFIGGNRRKEDLELFLDKFKNTFFDLFTPLAKELDYDLELIIEENKKRVGLV